MKPFKKLHNILSNQQVVFWIFLVVFILPNVLMFFTESTSLFTRIINIVLPLSLFWIALTLKNKPGKMLFWLFIFIFFNALQIGLLYLYGESPIAVDMFLNMFTSNPSEAQELIVNLLPAIFMVAVVYIGAIILAIYSWHNKNTLSPLFRTVQRKYGLCLLGASVIMTGINYVADRTFRIQDDVYPINASYNLALAVKRAAKSVNYKKSCSEFTYNARATRSDSIPEIYILVIGETSRADNYGIYGYERNTTPRLKALDSTLAVYRDAITVSNTTYKSVPMILTPVCVEDYDSIYSRKGVFTAFKEAGYNTAFYSNQRRNHSLLDVMGQEADDVKFIKDGLSLTASLPDMDLLKCLKEKLDSYNGGKLFIILHCYGSHFNYKDR
ncbi:MAG: sulfatase-like hydrolase/transferase, partial [Muribaculaceae bacterium]|nr:sulfatase-like hydrolase/transferase [Muribaculaceae bacterium]